MKRTMNLFCAFGVSHAVCLLASRKHACRALRRFSHSLDIWGGLLRRACVSLC